MHKKRGLFISRKGMDIDLWFNVFEFVVVFLAAGVLLEFINSESENITLVKNYYARDNALLISSIYASPGNVEYLYPQNIDGYTFNFKPNVVEVHKPEEKTEGGVISYIFPEDSNYIFSYKEFPQNNNGNRLKYTKNQRVINVER